MGKYRVFREYKTLEVGVKEKLIQEIHGDPLFAEDSVYIIEMFLKRYTHHEKYLKNALKFRTRHNLNNEVVGKLTKKDISYYDKELKKVRSILSKKEESPDPVINVNKTKPRLGIKKKIMG